MCVSTHAPYSHVSLQNQTRKPSHQHEDAVYISERQVIFACVQHSDFMVISAFRRYSTPSGHSKERET